MEYTDILRNSYLAGRVVRYHTRLVHHAQTVGEHSWQVMRIWWHIWGAMPPDVSTHLLWHDAAELATGDNPHTAKRDAPELKKILDKLEGPAFKAMGGPNLHEVGLTGADRVKFKLCDLIEMLEFAIVEIAMGNNFCRPVVTNCYIAIRTYIVELDIDDVVKVGDYLTKVFNAAAVYGVDIDPLDPLAMMKRPVEEAAE